MKDHVIEIIRAVSADQKLNVLREYLQAYLLRILQDQGFTAGAAFVGGTALRFLYDLPRYSEDLDFSNENLKESAFETAMKKLKDELQFGGYRVAVSSNTANIVQSAMVKFEQLLYELEISPNKNQKLSIKIELDTRPTAGAVCETTVVNKHFPLALRAYDTPSLFAGKLHALLSRKYTKGRDYFDLGWYLATFKGLEPNFTLLRNALEQTGWKGQMPTENNWRKLLHSVVGESSWPQVERDVSSFLEREADREVFTREAILKLLGV